MMNQKDLQSIREVVREENSDFRKEMRENFAGFRTVVQEELSDFRGEVTEKFDLMDKRFVGLENKFDQLQFDIAEMIEDAIIPQIQNLSDKIDVMGSNMVRKSELKVMVDDYCREFHGTRKRKRG